MGDICLRPNAVIARGSAPRLQERRVALQLVEPAATSLNQSHAFRATSFPLVLTDGFSFGRLRFFIRLQDARVIPAKLAPIPRPKLQASDRLALCGIDQQRVALARALVMRPKLLLADEPTGNLDSRTSSGVHELFHELNETLSIAMLVVTHNPNLAAIAKRKLQMEDGKLEELFETPPSTTSPATMSPVPNQAEPQAEAPATPEPTEPPAPEAIAQEQKQGTDNGNQGSVDSN